MNEQVAQNISTDVAVSIENMNKWYGTFHVLRDIDLTVYQGERIVIAGPSGSGKSTLIPSHVCTSLHRLNLFPHLPTIKN